MTLGQDIRLVEQQLDRDERLKVAIDSRVRLGRVPYFLLLRGFFLALTDHRLVGLYHRRWTGRPGSIAFEVPQGDRSKATIVEYPNRLRVAVGPHGTVELLLDPRHEDVARIVADELASWQQAR